MLPVFFCLFPFTVGFITLLFQGPLNYSAYFIGAYYIPYQTGTYTPMSDTYNISLAYLLVGGLYITVSFILIFAK